MAQKQKAVVLFSGGVDSTTCLALAIERFGKDNVVPLSIQYGQKHSKELEAAASILAYYGIEYLKVHTRNNKKQKGKVRLAPMCHLEMVYSYLRRLP